MFKREIHRAFWSLVLPLECLFFTLNIYANCKFSYCASLVLEGLLRNFSLRNLQFILKTKMFLYKKGKRVCRHNHLPAMLCPRRHLEQKRLREKKNVVNEGNSKQQSVTHNLYMGYYAF